MRRFAISDIHGCDQSFQALLDKIGLTTADELYLLGDYIDRGPDSKGVIDRILQLRKDGYRVNCLMGNHEHMMLNAAEDTEWMQTWLRNGGWNTLRSFRTRQISGVPEKYTAFLHELDLYFEIDGFILVHAGLNFKENDPLGHPASLLWIREWYGDIDPDWLGDRLIVHGHTPLSRNRIEEMLTLLDEEKVLDIDGGCVFRFLREELGSLCAFDMTNRRLHFQPAVDNY